MANPNAPLAQSLEGTVRTPDQFTSAQLENYGRIFKWTPRFIVYPGSVRDIVTLVRFCRKNGWSLTARGAAHSQSQLAINQDGVLVEMQSLNRIGTVDEGNLTVDVEPGVIWSDLVHHLATDDSAATRKIPYRLWACLPFHRVAGSTRQPLPQRSFA